MFDLDQHVRTWREASADTLAPEVIDELEGHLRDEFDRQTAAGLAPEIAWQSAVAALGAPGRIAGEFAKLRVTRWLPAWLAQIALALGVVLVVGFIIECSASGGFQPLLAAHVVFVTAGYGAVFAAGFIGICAVLSRAVRGWDDRRDASFRGAGSRIAAIAIITTLVGVLLGAWWSHNHLGRWWGWDPKEIGGLCVLAWSAVLLQSSRSPQATAPSRMCVAVMGNMVVALSWFGPVLLSTAHSYGQSSLQGMVLGGFLVTQIVIIYLAMVPAGALRLGRRSV